MRLPPIAVVVLIATTSTISCARKVDNAQHAPVIRSIVTGTAASADRSAVGKKLRAYQQAFYESRQFLPAWVDGDVPTPQMKDLIQQLHYAEKHGLDPEDYGVSELEALLEQSEANDKGTRFEIARVPEIDTRFTSAYLRYAADLLGWRAQPRQVFVNWLKDPKEDDLGARLAAAITSGGVRASLEDLAPEHPQYKGLQAALVREKTNPTGRADLLKMNLERWRWLPRDLGDRYVLINVPAYQMQVMEGEKAALAMRVIVGAADTPTPLFSDEMTYVVFSPYWNIPESILREETLPRLARDPDYLRRNNLEIVGTSGTIDPSEVDWSDESATRTIKLRQAPGPENALGLVKFIFPNHFNVYLHDTPGDRLFARDKRALSHGCIRVEKPVALADYVLKGKAEWTEPRIVAAMNAEREQTVKLGQALPVHIGYWTAWVEPDASVSYTDDPYGIDAAHARLRAGRPRPVTGAPTGA
jgi:murein L,D-transpeptidase YcbB/YkuD